MVYFPTEQDWMLTTRPKRVPLEEHFLKHLAVNSLQTANRRAFKSAKRHPINNPPGGSNPPRSQVSQTMVQHSTNNLVSRLINRMEPNLVLLGTNKEEGKLPEPVDLDSNLDFADMASVERVLDWSAEPPMVGAWN